MVEQYTTNGLPALLFIFILFASNTSGHQIEEIHLPSQDVFGLTNRMIEINFQPNVSKIFSAKASHPNDEQYLAVRPAKLLLQPFRPHPFIALLPQHA